MEKQLDRVDIELDFKFALVNGQKLSSFLEKKLLAKGYDITVYPFILDDYADITVDCYNCINKRTEIEKQTKKLLDEQKIFYKIA